jgi:hypothetical protein
MDQAVPRSIRGACAAIATATSVLLLGAGCTAPTDASPVQRSPSSAASVPASSAASPAAAAADGEVLAYVESLAADGVLVYREARWLGSRPDDFSCADHRSPEFNVERGCVRKLGAPPRTVRTSPAATVTSDPGGDPPATENLAWLGKQIVVSADNPNAGHNTYWLTLRGGVVVDIKQVRFAAA